MRAAYSAQQVRAAERPLLALLGDEPVMRRAAFGLEVVCARLLAADRGLITGASVVLLVGTGNNGGDALWAGAGLASRGARVIAVPAGPVESMHVGGLAAFERAGGRVVDIESGMAAMAVADLIVDGLLGIGARGALRSPADQLARCAARCGALVVACDLPSGIDPDTGAVPGMAVRADVTVTFGALKPGLLMMPAAEYVGVVELIDIGIEPYLDGQPVARALQATDVAELVPRPTVHDHKYSRGVVVIDSGSSLYPGAAVLSVGAARRGGAGLIHYCGGVPDLIVGQFPDVVVGNGHDARATAALVGPGLQPGTPVPSLLELDGPVLLDATALREVGAGGAWADAVRSRAARGAVTVMTPHDGELLALGGSGELLNTDRVAAARAVADSWGAVVLLKGATTVVAAPGVTHEVAWVTPMAPSCLATAGSGDVLAGLAASWLAAAQARAPLDLEGAARVTSAASWVHAMAGSLAGEHQRPVAASDLVTTLPEAVSRLLRSDAEGGGSS